MVLSIIGFFQQLIEWRRAKRCKLSLHKWEYKPHPKRPDVQILRCKYCHSSFWMGNDPPPLASDLSGRISFNRYAVVVTDAGSLLPRLCACASYSRRRLADPAGVL